MNIKFTLLALCALSLPAFAQMTPAQTNLDPAAARQEARNARADHQLSADSPQQALANELQRCAPLPPFYKSDCEARVRGQAGQSSGSVIGGGILRETVTTVPKAQLQALENNPQEMDFPKPLRQPGR